MLLHHNEDSVRNLTPPTAGNTLNSGEFELLGPLHGANRFSPYKYIVFIAFDAHTPCFAAIHLEA